MLETTILVTTIATLGMLSPGPDFFLVVKNSLRYDRKAALLTCFGVTSAIVVHMTYCVAGLAVVITSTPWLFNVIKYAGSVYLIWIGFQALRSTIVSKINIDSVSGGQQVRAGRAFVQGFLCNILNPKATLFFLAMFSQVLDVNTGLMEKIWYAFIIWFLALIWWPILTCIIQSPLVRDKLLRVLPKVDKLLGMVLIGFGIRVALT